MTYSLYTYEVIRCMGRCLIGVEIISFRGSGGLLSSLPNRMIQNNTSLNIKQQNEKLLGCDYRMFVCVIVILIGSLLLLSSPVL